LVKISIIIPVLNEAQNISGYLSQLQSLRTDSEIIIVDGGSQDNTTDLCIPLADKIIQSPRGRAIQMNAGAKIATGKFLLFLHADTSLPANSLNLIEQGLSKKNYWGRFDVQLSGNHFMFQMIAFFINWRSRLTGVSTGDQTLFVKKKLFYQAGQFPEIPLMEDIAICKKLKKHSVPLCLKAKVITSSRRWQNFGIFRTVLLMWWLRLLYFLGCNPESLSKLYSKSRFIKCFSN
jgi:rSAM/selenodomain-associated transferase 2